MARWVVAPPESGAGCRRPQGLEPAVLSGDRPRRWAGLFAILAITAALVPGCGGTVNDPTASSRAQPVDEPRAKDAAVTPDLKIVATGGTRAALSRNGPCDPDIYDPTATSRVEKCSRRLTVAAKRQGSLAISFDPDAEETVILMPEGVALDAPAPVPPFRVMEARFTKEQYDEAHWAVLKEAQSEPNARDPRDFGTARWGWGLDAATGQILVSTENADALARLEASFPGIIRGSR